MANKTITMLQIRKVLQLLDQGFSQRRIAREVLGTLKRVTSDEVELIGHFQQDSIRVKLKKQR